MRGGGQRLPYAFDIHWPKLRQGRINARLHGEFAEGAVEVRQFDYMGYGRSATFGLLRIRL